MAYRCIMIANPARISYTFGQLVVRSLRKAADGQTDELTLPLLQPTKRHSYE